MNLKRDEEEGASFVTWTVELNAHTQQGDLHARGGD
jgi:hypothetical protein